MARPKKPKPTFLELPRRKQSLAVSRLYLVKCTDKPYLINRKPSKDYICIARWFEYRPEINLQIVFTYLDSLTGMCYMDITTLLHNAKKHNEELISKESRVKEKLNNYDEYNMSMLEELLC